MSRRGAVMALVLTLAACGPKAHFVSGCIDRAKDAERRATEAGARDHSPDLMVEVDDLLDQAQSALKRGENRQAMLAAELAERKADEAMPPREAPPAP